MAVTPVFVLFASILVVVGFVTTYEFRSDRNRAHDLLCGCARGRYNIPCGHDTGTTNLCPTWSTVSGCHCGPVVPHTGTNARTQP